MEEHLADGSHLPLHGSAFHDLVRRTSSGKYICIIAQFLLLLRNRKFKLMMKRKAYVID